MLPISFAVNNFQVVRSSLRSVKRENPENWLALLLSSVELLSSSRTSQSWKLMTTKTHVFAFTCQLPSAALECQNPTISCSNCLALTKHVLAFTTKLFRSRAVKVQLVFDTKGVERLVKTVSPGSTWSALQHALVAFD